MNTDDLPEFESELSDMMLLLSNGRQEPSGRLVQLWFETLAPYPMAAVKAAMHAFRHAPDTGRTLPIPADIIKAINAAVANDGRPGADEAWAIAAQSVNEATTVVWTQEIAEAWGVARHVMALGDEVGARVAFRDAYNRIVHDARCARRPLEWLAALGTDRAGQASALRIAASQGRISRAELAEFEALPAPGQAAGMLLLAGDNIERDADGRRGPTPEDRARMADWLARMAVKPEPISADAMAREETAALQADSAAKVAAYVAGQGGEGVSDA